jgi:hypothetical protein
LFLKVKKDKFVQKGMSMPTIQVKSNIQLGLDDVLEGIAQLDTPELERFLEQVNRLVARRKAPSLSKREAELLVQINQGIGPEKAHRYRELSAKLREETITPEEHEELLVLIDEIETMDAERLGNLIELAHLRGISLDELMNQLGLRPPADA